MSCFLSVLRALLFVLSMTQIAEWMGRGHTIHCSWTGKTPRKGLWPRRTFERRRAEPRGELTAAISLLPCSSLLPLFACLISCCIFDRRSATPNGLDTAATLLTSTSSGTTTLWPCFARKSAAPIGELCAVWPCFARKSAEPIGELCAVCCMCAGNDADPFATVAPECA